LKRPRLDDRDSKVVFHPALERAMQLAAADSPAAVDRARSCLGRLLAWTAGAPAAWSASTLSMNGFPVELALSSADPCFRYTVEIADPASACDRRLDEAVAALERLGAPIPSPEITARLGRLQSGQELKYGAWLGGRHRQASDGFKLYAEIPRASAPDADSWSHELLGSPPVRPGDDVRVEMIGYDESSRRIELYHQVLNMHPAGIRLLLRRAGLEARNDEVLGLLQACYPFPMRRELPSSVFGFSYSIPFDGGPVLLSLYTFAVALFGGDGFIRSRLLELGARHGWDLAWYAKLTEPLQDRRDATTCHGMFGITLAADGPLHLSIGLTPPTDSATDTGKPSRSGA
jgi:hypothetical protein